MNSKDLETFFGFLFIVIGIPTFLGSFMAIGGGWPKDELPSMFVGMVIGLLITVFGCYLVYEPEDNKN